MIYLKYITGFFKSEKKKKKRREFRHRCHMHGMVNNGEWWRGPKCHAAALWHNGYLMTLVGMEGFDQNFSGRVQVSGYISVMCCPFQPTNSSLVSYKMGIDLNNFTIFFIIADPDLSKVCMVVELWYVHLQYKLLLSISIPLPLL